MKLQTLYAYMHVCVSLKSKICLKSDIYHPSEKRPLCIKAIKGAEGVNKMTKTLDIAFYGSWCLLKEPFLKRINPGVGVDLLLLRLPYLMTALVPSLTACSAISPGSNNLMACLQFR